MKAIQVRFLPATDFKGARVKAFTEGDNEVTIPFQYEVSSHEAMAEQAAIELLIKLDWQVKITGSGMIKNGDYVFTVGAK